MPAINEGSLESKPGVWAFGSPGESERTLSEVSSSYRGAEGSAAVVERNRGSVVNAVTAGLVRMISFSRGGSFLILGSALDGDRAGIDIDGFGASCQDSPSSPWIVWRRMVDEPFGARMRA